MKSLKVQKFFSLGDNLAITSVCSANKYVIKSSMLLHRDSNKKILIESTSNQVDQFGGYTGMTPKMFFTAPVIMVNRWVFILQRLNTALAS